MRAAKLLTCALAVSFIILTAACVQRVESRPAGSVAPALVLEQFLRAANAAAASDSLGIAEMGRLFGTKDGPVTTIDPKQNIEQRMFLIASILKHDDYKVQGEQLVPGRSNEATQLNVEMTIGPRKVVVPFIMVRGSGDAWRVEDIGLAKITGQR